LIILYTDISEADRMAFEAIARMAVYCWIEVEEEDVPEFFGGGHLSYLNRSTLFRLALEDLAPADCHRLIYLDADIIVVADIADIYNIDLGDNYVAAVTDLYVYGGDFRKRWGLPLDGDYFNAGLIVMDMDKIRQGRLLTKAMTFLAEYGDQLPYNDQDAMNWAFWGKWLQLPMTWNTQREMAFLSTAVELRNELRLLGRRPSMIHFTCAEKPWDTEAWHPWSCLYWKYLARTPFYNRIREKSGATAIFRAKLWVRYVLSLSQFSRL